MNPGRDAVIIVVVILALGVAAFSLNATPQSVGQLSGNTTLPESGETNRQPTNSFVTTNTSNTEERLPPLLRANRLRPLGSSSGGSGIQGSTPEERDIESQIEEARAEIALLEEKIEEIETFGEPSPYKGLVTIQTSQSNPKTRDIERELIRLDATKSNTQSINISKWRLESAITGRGANIGEAVRLFFSGADNSELPVELAPDQTAYVLTGRSPIGESFLLTKCTGYFTQFQRFYPSFSKQCPLPEEEIAFYTRDQSIFTDNECLDYIDRISRCTVQVNPLPLSLSPACQEAIIEEINYNSCVEKHKDDSDFYLDEWRIYLKRSQELWRDKREIILLVDEKGKTVDYYTY